MLRETAETFGSETTLRGILHWPTNEGSTCGLVMCHPFGEERKSAARVMVRAARGFCHAGFHVLRFDYRGTGESDGDIATARLTQWVEDIRQARQHVRLRTGIRQVGVLGVRFAATLATLLSDSDGPLPFLVLWAPLWSGRSCLNECLRHLSATRLVVDGHSSKQVDTFASNGAWLDLGGWALNPLLRADLEGVDMTRDAKATAEKVVVIDFSQKSAVQQMHGLMCHRLAQSCDAWWNVHMPGRPFWVTASRFDPQPLVDCTLEHVASGDTQAGRP